MVEDENNFDEVRDAFDKALTHGLEDLYAETLQTMINNMEDGKDALGNAWRPILPETLFHSREVRTSSRDPLVDTGEYRADILATSEFSENPRVGVIGTTKPRATVHEFGEPEMGIPRRPMFGPAARYADQQIPKIIGEELDDRLDDIELNGPAVDGSRLPNNLNVSFYGAENKAIVRKLRSDLAVSAGSACTTGSVEASHVLQALGGNEERWHSAIRFGLGKDNTIEEIDFAADSIVDAINELRRISF
jgi:phage gpG-like protein